MQIPKYLQTISLLPLFSADEKNNVGGQALIEGVMMRGKEKVAWAVRKPSGETVTESFPFVSLSKRVKILGIPVIRGVINLFESLNWGYKALSRSADISIEEDEDEEETPSSDVMMPFEDNKQSPSGGKETSIKDKIVLSLTMIIALAVSVGLFMLAPMWAAQNTPVVKDSPMLFNLMAGAVRIALFLIYISLVSLWSEMRRVFEYHGAEHKTIFAHEDGKALTIENVEPYKTVHPRCGTSFLILVAICSILLFSVIDTLYIQYFGQFVNVFHRFAVHLILIPLVAGMSYEALKLSDKFQRLPVVGWLIAPGLWLQKITTRKPDSSQIEVAIKALEAAL
jgi:uncharacterized protein YqhQ